FPVLCAICVFVEPPVLGGGRNLHISSSFHVRIPYAAIRFRTVPEPRSFRGCRSCPEPSAAHDSTAQCESRSAYERARVGRDIGRNLSRKRRRAPNQLPRAFSFPCAAVCSSRFRARGTRREI